MRDACVAALLGPARLLVTTLGTLALYRVVMARAGLEMVGLWTVLNLTMAFVSLADLGFSQVLVREAHGADGPGGAPDALADKRAVERFYRCFLAVVAAPAALAAAWLWPDPPCDRARLSLALLLAVWAGTVQMLSGLEAAVLAAVRENARIQAVNAGAQLLFLVVSLGGCLLGGALEGLALGNLASALAAFWWLRRVRARCCPAATTPEPQALRGALKRVAGMVKRGRYFYALSLGACLREPLFRVAIASFLGVKALGVYAIAFRAGVATRDLVAGGFDMLYPAMSALRQGGTRRDVRDLHAASILVLASLGCAALGCLYGLAGPLLSLVLGELPDGLVNATRILAIWNLITLFNVPFCHLLKANGLEKAAAASLWMHTTAVLILWPVQASLHLDLESLLWYWTTSSLAAQAPIYIVAQRRLDLFWSILKIPAVRGALFLASTYLAVVICWAPVPGAPAAESGGKPGGEAAVLLTTVLFLVASASLSWAALKRSPRLD